MSDYDNNNSGALFNKRDEKKTENHPDYTGNAEVSGVEYWVSAWIKKSKAGATYMSLSFTPKDASKAPAAKAEPAQEEIDSADIPF